MAPSQDSVSSRAGSDSRARVRQIGLLLGPLWLILALLLPAPSGLPIAGWHCAGLALLMATWWATEAIPIPATALLPLALGPLIGIGEFQTLAHGYADDIIFLFLGGFLIGLAMQRWNLHRRIALTTLRVVGSQPRRQIAGFMIATGFISMWVSNTATSVMMLPIGTSVIALMADRDLPGVDRYATNLLLGIAYAASIGGTATLIGTPPNALLAGYLSSDQGIDIGFAQWMLVGVPTALLMMAAAWAWLTRGGFEFGASDDTRRMLDHELTKLGSVSPAEKRVGLMFLLAAALWITRPLINDAGADFVSDALIAMVIGVALFIVPAGDGPSMARSNRLMSWENEANVPWGVLLLFGGGLALAGAIKSTGLAAWIADSMEIFAVLPMLLLIGAVALTIILLTEVSSNTATAAVFMPLLGALAASVNVDVLLMTVPAALAASCAFMMPVATPPNAIVFASGRITIGAMVRAGAVLNVACVVLATLIPYAVITWVW
ncbi:DASS family sodium-coupled anion symporter [Salinisphaera sp. Q1T1-3]|uniref:SLC13 family permease n=1 Tax=Salinisphaera sp. Q1T1-3 TaxID=2321229 RepID=UPI000E76B5CF|nr:SLC13 family permease [Salinisphaera sp. Q1T1-3]RJS91086.1 SLC13/DASS family transporter [Salinisphaera sp. Q1T1-3]